MRIIAAVLVTILVLSVGFAASINYGFIEVRGKNSATAQQPAEQAAPQVAAPTAPQPPPEPQMSDQRKYQDWTYGCVGESGGGDETRCQISQSVLNADTRRQVFFWRIFEDGQGGLMSVFQTPDAVQLQQGIRLNAGTPEPIVVPFASCGGGFCQAGGRLAPDFVLSLAAADNASATVVAVNGEPVTLPVSVSGLAEALSALRVTAPAEAPPSAPADTPGEAPAEAPAQQ